MGLFTTAQMLMEVFKSSLDFKSRLPLLEFSSYHCRSHNTNIYFLKSVCFAKPTTLHLTLDKENKIKILLFSCNNAIKVSWLSLNNLFQFI